jgi:triosephosphate isomerase
MLIAGNWKMNGLADALGEARSLSERLGAAPVAARVAICPPATLMSRLAEILGGGPIEIGGQDCHAEPRGAFTGDLAPEMLADAGARLVILGHSERRAGHQESDAIVAAKIGGALRAGLEPIVCVGESLEQRRSGAAEAIVTAQIEASLPEALSGHAFSVAYEPVWAIGSGLTPTLGEIAAMHAAIRATLRGRFGEAGGHAPILYGGSVKPGNAAEILTVPDVGGALVGGASLLADDFEAIIRAG